MVIDKLIRPKIALAPMMKVTTPCFRKLIQLIAPTTILYTEMITASTIINLNDEKLQITLGNPDNQTVVQIGGSNPKDIVNAIKRLKQCGWRLFNLNCGCPSTRVQKGMFGAILMKYKELVIEIINTVYIETQIILSIKCRTGIDEFDSYEFLKEFIESISKNTPCNIFYIHARKCWLQGINPKQNRNIPPLNYDYIFRIKKEFPHLFIGINGGITYNSYLKYKFQMDTCDGIMIGREAIKNPLIFAEIINMPINIQYIIQSYFKFIEMSNFTIYKILYPLCNLRRGKSNSKHFKQMINQLLHNKLITVNELSNVLLPFFID